MRTWILAALMVMPTTSYAQPYSESMADCASVYQNAAQWVNTDESADKMMHAAIAWADAALVQSQAEGRATTIEAIWDKIDGKTAEWEAKGSTVFFSQEFRDWMQYCRKFAKHNGVSINP